MSSDPDQFGALTSGTIMPMQLGSPLALKTPPDLPLTKPVCGSKPLTHQKKRNDNYRNVTVWPPVQTEAGDEPPIQNESRTYVNQAPLPRSRHDSTSNGSCNAFYANGTSSHCSPSRKVGNRESNQEQTPGCLGCSDGKSEASHVLPMSSAKSFVTPTGGRSSAGASCSLEVLPKGPRAQLHNHIQHVGNQRLTGPEQGLFSDSLSTLEPRSGKGLSPGIDEIFAPSHRAFTPPLPSVAFPEPRIPADEDQNHPVSAAKGDHSGEKRKLDYQTISKILEENRKKLESSGWFHENLGARQSEELLRATAPGTFLVRHSSDPRCLFSLSVQQGPSNHANDDEQVKDGRGPTSSRIYFHNGKFQMDVLDDRILKYMPPFDSVVELVEYYVKCSSSKNGNNRNVWVDNDGNVYRIYLSRPFYKQPSGGNQPSSLYHLCRRAVHTFVGEWKLVRNHSSKSSAIKRIQNLDVLSKLNLPTSVKLYLMEYPHIV